IGSFREDLFYRLNVVPIFLPALADRKDDIENLINIFIKKFNAAHGKRISGVAPDALTCLKKYQWPGNIRELENVIEHAFVLESSNVVTLASLPETVLSASGVDLNDLQTHIQATAAQLSAPMPSRLVAEIEEDDDTVSGSVDDVEMDAGEDVPVPYVDGTLNFNAQKEAFEKEFIIKALKTFKGRINQTALHANIPKKTLLRKIEKYGIVAKEYSL
ncbi:MAG: sigma-54-dependent Fis family transcriptional regulator, partial [Proteobacteria bacterium]